MPFPTSSVGGALEFGRTNCCPMYCMNPPAPYEPVPVALMVRLMVDPATDMAVTE